LKAIQGAFLILWIIINSVENLTLQKIKLYKIKNIHKFICETEKLHIYLQPISFIN
jgi:hypothetical protein